MKDDQAGVEESWLMGALDNGTEGIFPEAYVQVGGCETGAEVVPPSTLVTSTTSDSLRNGGDPSSMLSTSEQSSFTAVPASGPSPIPGKVCRYKGVE